MNIRLKHILLSAFLLASFAATAQVTVGGSVFGGGNMANVTGSTTVLIDQNGAVVTEDVYGGGALAKVNTTDGTTLTDGKTTHVTVKQGTVAGNVYGGGLGERPEGENPGTAADVLGPVTVTINGGTVTGSVFGCNNLYGAPQSTVQVDVLQTGSSMTVHNVYGGGNLADYTAPGTTPGDFPEVNIKHGTVAGNVFGGGYGATAEVTGNPQVFIGDDDNNHTATVNGNVYGGGDEAAVSGSPEVTVQNEHSTVVHEVYGGGNQADVSGSTTVEVIEGTVSENVYGGGALANVGTSNTDNTTVNILGGTVSGNVYGGGLGRKAGEGVSAVPAAVNGVVNVNIGALVSTDPITGFATAVSGSATIGGSVFGCNNTNGTPKDNVFVNIYQTKHNENTNLATYTANDKTYALSQVFGGGNQANYEPTLSGKKATVHIWTCDNTIQYVYGGGNAADLGTSGVNSATDVIIDGGRIEWVFGGGNGKSTATFTNPGANIYGNTNITFHAGDLTYIFGGSNEKGNVSGAKTVDIVSDGTCSYDNHIAELYGGSNMAPTNGNVSLTMDCPAHVCEIGSIFGGSRNADISGNVTLTIVGGHYEKVFGGNNIGGTISGNVTLNLYGGTIDNAYGGNNESGAINGKITVNVLDEENTTCPLILHNVYGGGYDACYNPTTIGAYPEVNIMHGTVSTKSGAVAGTTGNVFGGGYGTTAVVKSNPKVRVGYDDATMSGYIPEMGFTVTDADMTAVVDNNVFGGGDMAAVAGSTTVTLQHDNSSVANLFGGGNQASVGNATVNVAGGAVSTGVYGGCNESGSVGGSLSPYAATLNTTTNTLSQPNTAVTAISYDGTIEVNVTDGTIGADGTPANVLGGGYGNLTNTNGNVDVTINGASAVIWGDVYGGSAKGHVNDAAGDETNVTLTAGTIHGDLYGGGLGDDTYEALVNGAVKVTVNGGTVTNVFGCNNVNGAPQSTVQVDINETTANTMHVTNVFGGGNLAQYTGNPAVNIINGTVSQNVYGGGKGELVNSTSANHGVKGKVTGNPQVTIGDNNNTHTAHVTGDVYGGGDAANVVGTPVVVVNDCNTTIGYLYGGGNAADVTNANVTVNGGTITQAYGGGHGDKNVTSEPLKYADVNGDVVFNVYGGTIAQVFAGSNSKGSITGTSTLTVNKSAAANACDMFIGEVYGGGNEAAGNAGIINIGCTGTWTTATDDPTNNHDNHDNTTHRIGYELEGVGTVYGGANQADIGTSSNSSDISVTINQGIVENVFGGNNLSGTIYGTIQVEIDSTGTCDWYVGNVYGGGNQAAYGTADSNYPVVNIKKGLVSGDVFGGGLGLSGNPAKGKVTGNPQVTVNSAKARVNGSVYGGGSLASTQGDPQVKLTNGSVTKVFGGGKAADVIGAPTVTIEDGIVNTGVYGGCDSEGNVSNNITVNVTGGTFGSAANLALASPVTVDVYGGGFVPSTSTSNNVVVNIDGGIIYGDVYGGSAFGTVNTSGSNTTTVNIRDGELITNRTSTVENGQTIYYYTGGNVFGGGLGVSGDADKGKVNGKVVVNIGAGTPDATYPYTNAVPANTLSGNATIGGNVYGGNNSGGSPQDDVIVNVFQTAHTADDSATYVISSNIPETLKYAIAHVFGGGNEANFSPATGKKTRVNIYTCNNTIGRVFGGGNAAATPEIVTHIQGGRFSQVFGGGNGERGELYGANVNGDVTLNLHGGNIGEYYGGSNQHGTISGTIYTNVLNDGPCESVTIDEFFCGGNFEDIFGDLVTTIACSDGHFNSLYGGCNQANIYGNVILNLCGGNYTNVFGGSKGVAGGISADILDYTSEYIAAHPGLHAGDGGNITLNLFGGTIKNVFGGSNIHGNIAGNITVNVIDAESQTCPLYITNIYGGSNLTDYVPDSTNHAAVTNPNRISPMVNVMHAKYGILGDVYGGSKGETGATTPTKVMANPRVNIGYESSMSDHVPTGTDIPSLPSNTTWRTTIQGSVFGGGDAAKVEGNTDIRLNKHAKVIGNVYGGGNMGEVDGNTQVIINGKRQ